MDQAAAQQTVLFVLVVAGAVIVYDNIKTTGTATPSGKTLVSMLLAAAGLAWGAAVAPSIAGPFALLVGLAVILPRVPAIKGAK